ncbi:hypothetical protein [Actinomycetospora lemnae]|uniref:Uncharacterized protein n=1 Tax=Actinomycetospora lemnae TaxID=3019891 RepID=A0ABT5SPL7_9PSEU|nr:hypothetical protein [Actinomycetospora sp. DW7H6]MDD7964777.1 hypothetical protein [Actinomycetospora sp. DW7H6]
MVALAATGALIVGGGAATMVGAGNAAPLPELPGVPALPGVGTTYVTPEDELAPFTTLDTRPPGTAAVDDEFGAPTGGGEASLHLETPDDAAKASIVSREDAGTPLAEWIPTAAYSAYQGAAESAVQFPSLQLIVDFNGAAEGGFSTLTYEPAYNAVSTAPGQWNRYQAGAGDWCSTRAIPGVIEESQRSCSGGGDKPLAEYITAQPDIIVNGVVVNQGSGNPGLDAAVDLVSTPSTTYDFELTEPEVPGTDPCEEPTVPGLPGEGGENGGGNGGGTGGANDGHEDGGKDEPEGHAPNAGHEKPDNGHGEGGQEQPGHEQPGDGGHEPPMCAGS